VFGVDAGAGPGAVSDPGFHHVVYTKSTAEELRIYVDGVVPAGSTLSGGGFGGLADNSAELLLAGMGGGNHLAAIYDELVIYDEYLFDFEVAAIYAAGPTLIPEPASIALIGMGLVAMSALRRRTR
jgi:hypothetical protein